MHQGVHDVRTMPSACQHSLGVSSARVAAKSADTDASSTDGRSTTCPSVRRAALIAMLFLCCTKLSVELPTCGAGEPYIPAKDAEAKVLQRRYYKLVEAGAPAETLLEVAIVFLEV